MPNVSPAPDRQSPVMAFPFPLPLNSSDFFSPLYEKIMPKMPGTPFKTGKNIVASETMPQIRPVLASLFNGGRVTVSSGGAYCA